MSRIAIRIVLPVATCLTVAFVAAVCSYNLSRAASCPAARGAPSAAPSASVGPPGAAVGAEAGRVLARYRSLWPLLARASLAPPDRRRDELAPYLADPAYSQALRAMAEPAAAGRMSARADGSQASVQALTTNEAVVADCQESWTPGPREPATGIRMVAGCARNPVRSRLVKGSDGTWRVANLSYPGGAC